MAHPLEVSYNWRTPVAIATIGALGCLFVLARGRPDGWIGVALLTLALWGYFAFVMVRRARSYLMVDDSTLVLRPWRSCVRVEGHQVRTVKQVITARGTSYRLGVELADGETRRYVAPTAWVRGGHAALFNWLLAHAPDAELDKGSRRTLELLRHRGAIVDVL